MKVNYDYTELKNGMGLLLIPSKETYSINIRALIRSGSALESKENKGITHFVEHLSLMAPTDLWPTKNKRLTVTEQNGAYTNGSTSREFLEYKINIPHTKLDFGIESINQTLYHNIFDDESIEKERQVILDEKSKDDNDVYVQNFHFFARKLYKKQSAYSFPIIGTQKTIEKFSKNDLIGQKVIAHDPSKVLLTLVGNFSKKSAVQLIKNRFSKIKSLYKPKNYPLDSLKQSVIAVKKDKKTNNVITSLCFQGVSRKELSTRDMIALKTTIMLLSGPMSSRLFKRLRTKEGLLYDIGISTIFYSSFGSINIHYDISPENFQKALKITLEEILKFRDGVTQDELDHIKEYTINRNLVRYDNIHTYSQLIQYPVFYKKEILTLEEMNRAIKSLSLDEVHNIINKYFDLNRLNCLAYGNIDKTTEDIIRKELSNIKNA